MAFSYKQSDKEKKLTEKLSQYETYTDPQAVIDSQNAWKQYEANNKVADWTGGTYGQSLKDQMDKINNRKQFTYDLNGDALYQQYKDQYMTQGRLASADAIGQASAMTGGYGNSFAATVGNQAYQGYLQKLNDVVPELYNMAYNRYQQEGQDMKDMLAMYESAYGREYGEHRDKVSDYNTTVARLYDIYNNDRTYYRGIFDSDRDFYNTSLNNEKTWNYGLQKDAYDTKIAEEQWQKSYDLQKEAASKSSNSYSKQGGSAESDFVRFVHSGENEENGKQVFYRDGKKYEFDKGVNPYTGTKNADAKNGTFSNGYQPNNVGGNKLSKTGYTATVNGVTQNVWKTTEDTRRGTQTRYWVWDGTKNAYEEVEV